MLGPVREVINFMLAGKLLHDAELLDIGKHGLECLDQRSDAMGRDRVHRRPFWLFCWGKNRINHVNQPVYLSLVGKKKTMALVYQTQLTLKSP